MLKKNLRALENKYPKIVQKLTEIKEKRKNFEIIEAKNKDKTVQFNKGSKSFLLHSKYNPKKEAERMTAQINFDGLNSVVVLGFGLGYHILNLFRKIINKNIKIFVVENNLLLFKEALKYEDFSDLFNYDNFHLFLEEEMKEDEVYKFINSKVDLAFENIEVFYLPSVFKYAGEYYNFSLAQVEETIERININKNTVKKKGINWKKHFLENIDLVINTPGFDRFKGIFKGKPAIIVSAGPSLDKNMMKLKKAKGKAVILAVNTALKPLLRNGIIPDIVITIEEKDDLIDHLCNLDEIKGITEEELEKFILVFDPRVKPEVLRDWKGPLLQLVLYYDDYMIRWLEDYIGFKGRSYTGGSVAHAAFGFVYQMGADPIIFVGQDLAFSEKNTHVTGAPGKGTIEENKKEHKRVDYFKIEDINGELVWTRRDYYEYLKFFNRILKKADEKRTYIDATEGGAKIEGTQLMTLEKTIKEHCTQKTNVNKELLAKVKSFSPEWGEDLIEELEKVEEDIEKIKTYAQEGLTLVDKLVSALSSGNQQGVEKTSKSLKQINEKISYLKDNIVFFESDIYEFHLKRNFTSGNNFKILNNFVDFYNKLINGSKRTLNILDKKITLLKKDINKEEC